jgi:hypothetical protein
MVSTLVLNKSKILNTIEVILRHINPKMFLTEGALNWFLSVFCEAGLN